MAGLLGPLKWILKRGCGCNFNYFKKGWYKMKRFQVITNKSNTYPVYYVVDLVTGQKIAEELNKETAENICSNFQMVEDL